MTGKAVALIAATGDALAEATARVACAITRAVLGSGNRLLVHADAALLWPLLLTGLGYRPEAVAEHRETKPPPPLLMIPTGRGESIEDCLFDPPERMPDLVATARLGEPTAEISWMQALAELLGVPRQPERLWGAQAFREALVELQPWAVIAMGEGNAFAAGIDAAQTYAREFHARLFTVGAVSGGLAESAEWQPIESFLTRDLMPPEPSAESLERLDPERRHEWLDLAEAARQEAYLALAVSAAVMQELEGGARHR